MEGLDGSRACKMKQTSATITTRLCFVSLPAFRPAIKSSQGDPRRQTREHTSLQQKAFAWHRRRLCCCLRGRLGPHLNADRCQTSSKNARTALRPNRTTFAIALRGPLAGAAKGARRAAARPGRPRPPAARGAPPGLSEPSGRACRLEGEEGLSHANTID